MIDDKWSTLPEANL